jgi:hypothetical protein
MDQGVFTPKKESELASEFIGRFSTAAQEHHHYENGFRE